MYIGKNLKTESKIYNIVEEMLGGSIVKSLSLAGSGANSRIYKVETTDDNFALKFYRDGKKHYNDRLNSEKIALNLFKKNMISNVPTIYASDLKNNCMLMEWVDGWEVKDVNINNIDQLIDFILSVDKIKDNIDVSGIVNATEACLSASELIRQITNRIEKLSESRRIRHLFENNFMPLFEKVVDWVNNEYVLNGIDIYKDINIEMQTLSVVDFGLHNVIMNKNREMIFIDFEYFGLDDPVKLISDTLLHPHPLMRLSNKHKQYFHKKTSCYFNKDDTYDFRLKTLYPLYAFRWCTIILNPFLANYKFVDDDSERSRTDIQRKKIKEVSCYLKNIEENFKKHTR